jgi:hypothetical protein
MKVVAPILLEPDVNPSRNDQGYEHDGIRHAEQPAEHADTTAQGARDGENDRLIDR